MKRPITKGKEKSIVYHPEYKGVRLDVYAKDENQTRYNVEMQVQKKPALGKRSRYYQSQMDMEMLLAGEDYAELPNTYVIFICDFDPIGEGKYRYTLRIKCEESAEAEFEDGRTVVFLNTHGKNESEVPKELVTLLHYIREDVDGSERENSTIHMWRDFRSLFVKSNQTERWRNALWFLKRC